ncbi:MAG: hypothetical protein JRJ59_07330 [Deltaproteobacteria bacterium]|nr:hypothetical protein [Deltaproteobacteria bacterium]
MKSRTDLVLKAAKEVAVKYIETGRLSLSGFEQAFATIYQAIDRVVPRPGPAQDGQDTQGQEAGGQKK